MVFKNGICVVQDGVVQTRTHGTTQTLAVSYEPSIKRELQAYYDQFYNLHLDNFKVGDVSFKQTDGQRFVGHQLGKPYFAGV
ncbi:MAG: hypothetical protein HOP34_01775 [Methylococcaceae bacterium]|nr:hypothetical protein [Methylococcaceae bacterium]